MGGMGGEEFEVKVRKEEVITALLPLQEHWLPLSNLDLLLPPVDGSVYVCYKKPTDGFTTFSSMLHVLKQSLAQTLASYYAFAGEVVANTLGEPELLCNNRGIQFIEAFADVELRHLNLYKPDQSIGGGRIVPIKKHGIAVVQVTELKCGGTVIACTFDHRIADAYSANLFLVSWSENAFSKTSSQGPLFRRSILNPRRPGLPDPSINRLFVKISSLPPPPPPPVDADSFTGRIYYIPAQELDNLQSLASAPNALSKKSKLVSFSAFLWKLVAQISNSEGNDKKIHKMGTVVDGRARIGDGDIDMTTYFGNVLSIPYGEKTREELREQPLSWVAEAVHDYLKVAMEKEHFLSIIDWVEAQRPELAIAKIYCSGGDDGPAFVVTSGQRFNVSKVDFGWGKAAFGAYYFPWGGSAGLVMPLPSPKGNGDWLVYMHLLEGQLVAIEKEASHVLKPLTSDYLQF